eukprot:13126-Heterococcus_DN1.PRE.4
MRWRTALHANTKQTHGGIFICCSNLFGAQEAMKPTTHSLLEDTYRGVCYVVTAARLLCWLICCCCLNKLANTAQHTRRKH